MKLLLDENLPKRLKDDFAKHEVYSVTDKGWDGLKNGELLELMISEQFDALLTFDKNLQHQQNFRRFNLTVFVLSAPSNTYNQLTRLSTIILKKLEAGDLPTGPVVITL